MIRAFDWAATPLGAPHTWPAVLRTLVELMLAAPEPRFLAWGPEKIVLYNDGYAAICGDKHPWALGQPFARIWADILQDVEPIMARTYAGEVVHMEDIRFTMFDRHGYAEETHFSFTYIPVHDADPSGSGADTVVGMFCTCAETTARILTERMLAFQLQLGDRLRALDDSEAIKALSAAMLNEQLQVAQIGYAEVDAQGRHAAVTSAHDDGRLVPLEGRRNPLGQLPLLFDEMLQGRNVVLPDVAAATHRLLPDIVEECRRLAVNSLVMVPLVKHGALVAYLFLAHPEPRHWLPHEVELAHDVAERTWAAVERATSGQQLAQTRERLAATLEAANIATWDYDIARDVLVPDRNMAMLFGVPNDETLTGAPLESFVLGAHPDDQDQVRASFRAACATGSDWHTEYRLMQPGGSHRWLIARARIERDASGRGSRMLGVLVDITDRKQAEQALQEADRRKDDFLATLAHELRNPLAPIRSAARISSDPAATIQQLRWSHEVIERQVRTMALLLDDLLDVSRITRGILEVRRELIGLHTIVDSAVETARPLLEARRHALALDLGDVPVRVLADPLRMAQALSNLLTNAAKYTDPGGNILLMARLDGSQLELRVRDNGIGLTPAALQRVFAMFSQVESALDRSEGGLGIGLALVKGLVELHGGSVSAASAGPGLGSEFVLRIPNAVRLEPELAPLPPAPPEVPQAAGRRVALADDNEDGAETLAALLELDGHEVRIANDGLAALELVRSYRPEIAFLDIGMPGLNGYEVARQLRESPIEGAPLVLVALTGWGGADDRKRAMEAGFDHHLTKPVDPDAITEILARLG
ncbi:ATP-binding protein [Xylophilus sp. Leaf220]|uniref:hybrid sensor histidine kinase/response regulator n=1 Tax=Xylophilus sp. Leaf220 TaxID=1735686 RepID=UPI0006FEEF26|nr:ATP-binding protein [Xylophilus sp. Leaf220]KQM68459.1 hypothetical protein ASE76_14310 [Xylophilus sp. Leaf220]